MIGANALVSRGALVGHHVDVGAFSVLNPGVNIGGNTTIGEDVVRWYGSHRGQWALDRGRAVIAAGAVVLHDVDPGTRVQGVPARPVAPSLA